MKIPASTVISLSDRHIDCIVCWNFVTRFYSLCHFVFLVFSLYFVPAGIAKRLVVALNKIHKAKKHRIKKNVKSNKHNRKK